MREKCDRGNLTSEKGAIATLNGVHTCMNTAALSFVLTLPQI